MGSWFTPSLSFSVRLRGLGRMLRARFGAEGSCLSAYSLSTGLSAESCKIPRTLCAFVGSLILLPSSDTLDTVVVGEHIGVGVDETQGNLDGVAPASISDGKTPANFSLCILRSRSCRILRATSFSSCSSSSRIFFCFCASVSNFSSDAIFLDGSAACSALLLDLCRLFSSERCFLDLRVGLAVCLKDEPRSGIRPFSAGLSPYGPSTRFKRTRRVLGYRGTKRERSSSRSSRSSSSFADKGSSLIVSS